MSAVPAAAGASFINVQAFGVHANSRGRAFFKTLEEAEEFKEAVYRQFDPWGYGTDVAVRYVDMVEAKYLGEPVPWGWCAEWCVFSAD